jgi:hypothetical protein
MFRKVRDLIWTRVVKWLVAPYESHKLSPNDFEVIAEKILPADVLLVEGRTRVGSIIKQITRSSWSHAALCIGPINEIDELHYREKIYQFYDGPDDVPLLIEAEMDKGTVITPLTSYKDSHVRIARPIGLSDSDAQRICSHMIEHLGHDYDIKQLLDLARFMLPWWWLVPRKWQSSLFEHNAGPATRNVCSSLIAEAFQIVGFPVLPLIERGIDGGMHFYQRNPRLYTPRDFDYSPFFKILKYPLLSETPTGYYKAITWKEMDDDKRRVNYMNAEDVVFISGLEEELDVDEDMIENELSETPQESEGKPSEPQVSLEETRD